MLMWRFCRNTGAGSFQEPEGWVRGWEAQGASVCSTKEQSPLPKPWTGCWGGGEKQDPSCPCPCLGPSESWGQTLEREENYVL